MGTSRRMAEYLQAFYKRFSGPMGPFPAACRGADAWQITTCGHGVLQTSPHGRALESATMINIRRMAPLVNVSDHL